MLPSSKVPTSKVDVDPGVALLDPFGASTCFGLEENF